MKYRYRIEKVTFIEDVRKGLREEVLDHWNELGERGWRLVQVITVNEGYSTENYAIFESCQSED